LGYALLFKNSSIFLLKKYVRITDIQQDLQLGTITCEGLVQQYLQNIQSQNATLNSFIEIYPEEALALAKQQDIEVAKKNIKPLSGVVIGVKDLLCYKEHETTGGSAILKGFKSLFTATAISRLQDAGAIIIGRQNCDEFGMGSTNANSAYGPVNNAANTACVSGGSSGGSAVAVQANMCHVSIGTDTGGSVRQPASYCGVVGFKPTYSRVSRWGLKAYASSFDTIGPITHSVEDAALITQIMAGYDPNDATSSTLPVTIDIATTLPTLKIAYFKETIEPEALQTEVMESFMQKLDEIREAGHELNQIEFPLLKYALPSYYILTTAEASSNLARYDGVRYGHRSPLSNNLIEHYKLTRSEGFGAEVKKRIMLGTFVLSASYYDAYYTKAQKVRRLIKEYVDELFKTYDLLVLPVTPTTAPLHNRPKDNPLADYLSDIFTVTANVIGSPAVSIPAGQDSRGLPIGFQIMGPYFSEQKVLQFALSLENSKLKTKL
jgi:aspartyl-tRNA(Asn)/glutamyl-tRNA(Gln) amidotransferase subunit A